MDQLAKELRKIFLMANANLLRDDISLLIDEISERTICGALSHKISDILSMTEYSNYFVDVEYNRNKGHKIKTCYIEKDKNRTEIININCDLIVHSRGNNLNQDNLLAIEMKKSSRSLSDKESDKKRLKALTKDSFDDIWSFNGKVLPKHVCRYKLGIYYEINFGKHEILLEYYYKGNFISSEIINY